jgi:TniQ
MTQEEAAEAMYHAPISPVAPIPARVVPRKWEDLASYISRVAAEMGYKNPGWILHPEGVASAVHPYNLCRLRRKADYQFFEHLLCLNEGTIYDLTLHRFALCLLEPDEVRPALPEEIQRPLLTRYLFQTFFHPYSATKVCSLCLAEEPTHGRLYWNALPVIVCLHHKVFLTDRCPACQSPIPLLRPSLSKCPRCQKGDYREAPIVHLPADPLFSMGQALILRKLGAPSAMEGAEVDDTSRTPLLRLLPWQYFLFLDAFRCILGPLFPDAPFLRVSADTRVLLRLRPRPQSELSLLEWSVIIGTVHWLCTSWPDHFFAFLDALPHARSERRRKRDRQRATGLHRDFGIFYEKWLYQRLSHPDFAFVHEAFETYLGNHYTGGEVTKRLQPFKGRSMEQLQERPYLCIG